MFELVEVHEILRATPGTLRAMLGGLSDVWLRATAGPGTWSPLDIVGHLIVGEETDWIPRAQLMLEHGTAKPFEPFDREAQFAAPPRSAPEMLDRFASLRDDNLAFLDRIDASSLDARGIHPEFGEVRLGDMLATWAVHDLSHIAQIAETMAKRYRDDVGPWRRYLPVLDRAELPSE
jgi:hypothetical protein